jgi:hypothetical protein
MTEFIKENATYNCLHIFYNKYMTGLTSLLNKQLLQAARIKKIVYRFLT